MKKYENRPRFDEVIVKIKVTYFLRHGIVSFTIGRPALTVFPSDGGQLLFLLMMVVV